jgi:exodeoxyribonuclease VII small subunit
MRVSAECRGFARKHRRLDKKLGDRTATTCPLTATDAPPYDNRSIPTILTAVTKKSAAPDFEAALAELEKIVEKMESGDQSLEESLKAFQRGIELARSCQQGLKEAEQRVEKLIQQNGEIIAEPFTDNGRE